LDQRFIESNRHLIYFFSWKFNFVGSRLIIYFRSSIWNNYHLIKFHWFFSIHFTDLNHLLFCTHDILWFVIHYNYICTWLVTW
jgi:hypothetical protein